MTNLQPARGGVIQDEWSDGLCPTTAKPYELMMGDCLELMSDIPDGSVDMILCDLPYGTTACKWDTVIPFEPLWVHYKRVIKDNGAIVLFSAEPFTSALVMSNPRMFRYDLIWRKPQGSDFLNANRKPLRAHENICVFYGKQPTYNKQYWFSTPYSSSSHRGGLETYGDVKNPSMLRQSKDGRRNPLTVLDFGVETGKHPTQKPVPLMEWLVKTYTNDGETVLDNCMGSGSTGVACMNTSRRFIGMELEPKYFDIAKQRIERAANERLSLCR